MGKEYINGVAGAPGAIGPYSQAVITDSMLYISGQIPLDPQTGEMVKGGISEQANQVMSNLKSILEHCKCSFGDVVSTTIFLTTMDNFQAVNSVYEKWMGTARPARATVAVAGLPKGSLVEIQMTALRPN